MDAPPSSVTSLRSTNSSKMVELDVPSSQIQREHWLVIERYITDPEEWQPIRTQGRAWVKNERCWKETVHRYTDVYTGFIS